MSQTNCKKCGKPLPVESGAPAEYCSHCGAGQSGQIQPSGSTGRAKFGLGAIVLTSLLTSIIVLVVGGTGIYLLTQYRSRTDNVGTDPGRSKTATPDPKATRIKQPSSVPASEITKVVWSRWHHEGPLMGGGRVVSNTLEFTRDLAATKTEAINHDSDDKNDKTLKLTGTIDRGHFDKLSGILVENDFLNEPDAPDRITESENSLIITYTSGEKKIKLSNTSAKDSPEMEDVKTTLTALNAFVRWAEAP